MTILEAVREFLRCEEEKDKARAALHKLVMFGRHVVIDGDIAFIVDTDRWGSVTVDQVDVTSELHVNKE